MDSESSERTRIAVLAVGDLIQYIIPMFNGLLPTHTIYLLEVVGLIAHKHSNFQNWSEN